MRQLGEYSLTQENKSPKYEQLKNILLDYISQLSGNVEYLPYEYDIEESLGVSKNTVRRALNELRKEGVIETVRNRGSKILKRDFAVASLPQIEQQKLAGLNIGAVITGLHDHESRTELLRWQIITQLEELLSPLGASVVTYNLRGDKWSNLEELVASMQDNGIFYTYFWPHPTTQPESVIEYLLAAMIKPVAVIKDLQEVIGDGDWLGSGVDYILVNHLHAIKKTMHENYSDIDGLVYVTNIFDRSWSMPREKVYADFAKKVGVPFDLIIVDDLKENLPTSEDHLQRQVSGRSAALKIPELIKGRKRPLCVAANDGIAVHLHDKLHELGIKIPDDLLLIGHDNRVSARSHNISSFDSNSADIAKVLLDCLGEHMADPKKLPGNPVGKMVYPKFVKRLSS